MKKPLLLTGIVVTLLAGFFLTINAANGSLDKLLYYSPCDKPIEYSIGTIDPGFQVTREELIRDAAAAANIWSNTQGKELFRYNPNSEFTINMVYDDRQALTSKISELDNRLKQKQGEIDPQLEDFNRRQDEFIQKVNNLNERIRHWNSQGGAPKEEYDKLVAEQKALQEEGDLLNALARELGQSTREYNLGAQALNKTISEFKEVLVDKPEEGLYEQEGNKRKISIFIDVDKEDFLHTLAHEFGHALGLSHTSNPESIMYPQTNNVLIPSQEEIDELTYICRKRTVFEEGKNRIVKAVEIIRERIEQRTN